MTLTSQDIASTVENTIQEIYDIMLGMRFDFNTPKVMNALLSDLTDIVELWSSLMKLIKREEGQHDKATNRKIEEVTLRDREMMKAVDRFFVWVQQQKRTRSA